MKKRWLLFTLGWLVFVLPEILRVYFIMPFPGSQIHNTVGIAYFLYRNIMLFRIVGGLLILIPFISYWRKSRWWQKMITTVFVAVASFIFYVTNYVADASKIFLELHHKNLVSVAENKIPPNNLILGVYINGDARAYPIEIMGYQHRVPDTVGGTPLLVTYCTVCRSGRVFDPAVNGKVDHFRLVGMDHFNAMIEDETTHTWWRQENGEAVAGKLKGNVLKEIPSQQMTLRAWIALHPDTRILQPDKDFDYSYLAKYDEGTTADPLEYTDRRSWQNHSWVIGVSTKSGDKAYDWNTLAQQKLINDSVKNIPIVIWMENDSMSFYVFNRVVHQQQLFFQRNDSLNLLTDTTTHSLWNQDGICVDGTLKGERLEVIPAYQEFWHSWKQFHPATARL